MAAEHTYELAKMGVIRGEYVLVVEGNGEGCFELPREVPDDVVLVRRDDLEVAVDALAARRTWVGNSLLAPLQRLKKAMG